MTITRQQIFKITFIVAALCSIFLLVFAYLHYLDLKKILLSRLSDKATSLIGQKVDIGDLSFSPSGGIVFYALSIKNPEYFDSGQLLTIEKLSITMKFSGLLKGRFYFKKIGVHSPKLTVIKDMYGRLNISDKLKLFLSKKPAFTYQVDEFTIESGLFDLNKDERYRSEGINVTLRNLSSDPGTRTLINGSLFYAKTNKVKIEGWVYLKDEPRKFGISFSSDDIDLSLFSEYYSKYKVSTQRSKITMNAHAEGDTERGVHLKSKVQVTKVGFFFLKRGVKKIILNMDAFLSIQDGTVAVKDISVFSGDVATLRLKGIITDIKENPSYKGELTLDRIDLSVFNFMMGLDVRGLLTSDRLRIRGTFRKNMPELSGTVQLREGAVTSNDIDVKTVNARVVFLEDKTIEAKATAQVFRAGEYKFDKPADIRLSLNNIDLGFISRTVPKISDIPYRLSGDIEKGAFNGIMNSMDSLSGNAEVKARKISVFKRDSKRNILKNVSVDSKIQFAGDDLEFKADAIAGNISTHISGEMKKFKKEDRSMNIRAGLPEVKVTDIRDAFWDIFPDSILYAGFYGYISSDVLIDYSKSGLKLNGNVTMRDFILEGENNEYSVGPVNSVIPIAYAKPENGQKPVTIPSFERSEFDTLSAYYSQSTLEKGFSRITIGSFRYGFRLLKDIVVWVKPEGTVLNFERFSGTIFGGRFHGSAVVDMLNGFRYRAGIFLKGLSLTTLCEEIEPIKGYISGNIDGVAQFKGFGTGISQIIGKADFWTYSTDNEKTKISREFLRKIGGPSLKTYIGERRFDKGIMSLYVQNGFLIFKELEISNRNFFGLRDLSIKVMPFNNRIAIDHLMWTITEAAQRAKEKS